MNPGVQHPKSHTNQWIVERHRALPPPSSAHLAALDDHSESYSAVADSYPTSGGPYEVSPAKRVRISGVLASSTAGWGTGQQHGQAHDAEVGPSTETGPRAPKSTHREKNGDITVKMPNAIPQSGSTSSSVNTNNKSRRVRTGCLTCRGRHLKCDEAFPECNNCRKSCRECKRGLRLNFIDTQIKSPPFVPPTLEWSVQFHDESRLIASEYQGGLGRYPRLDQNTAVTPPHETELNATLRVVAQKQDAGDGKTYHPDNDVTPGLGEQDVVENGSDAGLIIKLSPNQPIYDGNQLFQPQDLHLRTDSDGPFTMRVKISQHHSAKDSWASQAQGYRRSGASSIAVPSFSQHDHQSQSARQSVPLTTYGLQTSQTQHAPEAMSKNSTARTTPSKKTTVERDYLSTDSEIYLMQVFISEVAPWMDILSKSKHFANMMSDLALKSPMLLNALLACGTMHLSLTQRQQQQQQQQSSSQPSGISTINKACSYYDLAMMELLRNLEQTGSPSDRNAAECATAATVLNAYDIMNSGGNPSPSPFPFPLSRSQQQQRVAIDFNIAGCARALVKECGWNANSASAAGTGVGEACFWFNGCMEVLSCLQPALVMMNSWQQTPTVWDPDQWGLDVNVDRWATAATSTAVTGNDSNLKMTENDDRSPFGLRRLGASGGGGYGTGNGSGEEELWAQRILYVLAKVVNFCSASNNSVSRYQETSPHDEQMRLQRRFTEWRSLNGMCDAWRSNCPRSMRPYGYVRSSSSGSLFPNVWLINRPALIARLFYHVAMCILAQVNPVSPRDSDANRELQQHHAQQVCGIAAHNKDRAVASIVTRCVATVGDVLSDRAEQTEALAILERISTETGWRLGSLMTDLKRAWSWGVVETPNGGGGGGGTNAVNGNNSGRGGGGVGGGKAFASALLGAGDLTSATGQTTMELPLPLSSRPPSILQLFGTSSQAQQQQAPAARTPSTAAATTYSNSPTIPNLTTAQPNLAITASSSRHQTHQTHHTHPTHQSKPSPPSSAVGVSQQAYQRWYQQAPSPIRPGTMSSQQMGGTGGSSSLGWG
ncbi:hypothetical protein B0T13DRAFT_193453 [Neurospora crassa]|nr:hypothetical protein B0T13DRAFT_193453 [Neurospora crassa]